MMIFNKFGILRGLFQPGLPPNATIQQAQAAAAAARAAAADVSMRWATAATKNPELRADVLRLGGVLTTQPIEGGELAAQIDPYRLAYEAGRRDLALQLATMMGMSLSELATLMETNDAND